MPPPPTLPGWLAFVAFVALYAACSITSERTRHQERRPASLRLLQAGAAAAAVTVIVLLGRQLYTVLAA